MAAKKLPVSLLIFLFASITFLTICHAAKPSLEKKIATLNHLSINNKGIVELDSNSYDEIVAKPRNYSLIILFTALEAHINCMPCKEFDPEFRLVAESWIRSGNELSRLYFGVLDFRDGREVYVKLNLNNAPTLFYFPPTIGPHAKAVSEPDKYDFNRRGFSAEELASYLSTHLETKVLVNRPLNYLAISLTIFLTLGALAAIKLIYPLVSNVIRSKNTWAAMSLIIILMMISGHMWNHIRGTPYVISQNGQISYIAQGFSSQLGMESQIVAMIYGVCAFSVVSLISSVPKIEDNAKQRLGVYVWMGVLVGMFSLLFALFRIKNPGYPFRLFI